MKNKNVKKVVDKYNKTIVSKTRKNLKDHTASGTLSKSLKSVEKKDSEGFDISILMEDYGTYVDEGRKPGKGAPIKNIRDWVKLKGIGDIKKIDSIVYLINRKIKEKGIKPTNFLSDAVDDTVDKFANDLANAFGDDILDELNTIKIEN